MEADVQQADLVLWVGISFEQSASTAYFRRVSCVFFTPARQATVPHSLSVSAFLLEAPP